MYPSTDAQWFTREEVLKVLNHPAGTNFAKREYKIMNEIQDGPAAEKVRKELQDQQGAAALAHSDPSIIANEAKDGAKVLVEQGGPAFKVPPETAIAGVLIRQWAEQRIQANAVLQKGNL